MRVLFLTLYPANAASPRYRVAQFIPYLEANGVQCEVTSAVSEIAWRTLSGPGRTRRAFWYHAHETPRRIMQILDARGYDVVFVQKALCSAYLRGLPALLRARTRRIVYDIDDAVHLAPPHSLRAPWNILEDRAQVKAVMRMARVVLAGNDWLRAEATATGARAELFPTVVDTDRFTPAAMAGSEKLRIGWIGSPSTTPALGPILPALESIADAEIILAGADASQLAATRANIVPWSYESEADLVRGFSIGVMPLPKDEWTRGKCALKALLYMACGVPCIATPYGAAREVIDDGVNGVFADTPEQWRAAAERLRDPALRARIGAAARATVETRYALRIAAPRLLELLREAAA